MAIKTLLVTIETSGKFSAKQAESYIQSAIDKNIDSDDGTITEGFGIERVLDVKVTTKKRKAVKKELCMVIINHPTMGINTERAMLTPTEMGNRELAFQRAFGDFEDYEGIVFSDLTDVVVRPVASKQRGKK